MKLSLVTLISWMCARMSTVLLKTWECIFFLEIVIISDIDQAQEIVENVQELKDRMEELDGVMETDEGVDDDLMAELDGMLEEDAREEAMSRDVLPSAPTASIPVSNKTKAPAHSEPAELVLEDDLASMLSAL